MECDSFVLVQTTAKDGVFSVVQSWKGDLKPGGRLEVPGLKPNADAVPISSYPKPPVFGSQELQASSEQISRQPAESQMILFLKRKDDGVAGDGTREQWDPAGKSGGMKLSALWIDGGKAFCFQQWMNPGPSALSECWQFPVAASDVAVFTAV